MNPARAIIKWTIGVVLSVIIGGCADENTVPDAPGPEFDLLVTPVGSVRFPNGCNAEAAPLIERGVALIHHMMYEEADFVFTMAMGADQECGLAYWGQAMAIVHPLWPDRSSTSQISRGRSLMEKALAVGGTDEREEGYLKTAVAYFAGGHNIQESDRLTKMEKAWSALHNAYPDDVDAKAFYALFKVATASISDPELIEQKQAGQMAQEILVDNPDHPGAHHYLIHAYDFPSLAAFAESTADNYGKITPRVPHATHMMTHTYTRLGKWDKAIEWNSISAETALALCIENGEVNLHYTHALDYLAYAYLQKAEDEKVQQVLNDADELKPPYSSVNRIASAYAFSALPARYALERQDWVAAMDLSPRSPADFPWVKEHDPYVAITHFARAIGFARAGMPDQANEDIQMLEIMRDEIATYSEYWAKQVEIQRLSSLAWQKFAKGDKDAGAEHMKMAADLEATTEKNAVTPGEVLPAAELYGDMLLELGEYEDALSAYRVSLVRNRGRYNSLLGAGRAAMNLGDKATARQYFYELLENTNLAGETRATLSKAREMIKEL